MCFVWIWAIIFLCSIHWLVCITERYELNLHIFNLIPIFVEARVRCRASWCAICVVQVATETCLDQYFISPSHYHSTDAPFTSAWSLNASKSRVVVPVHPIRCALNVGQWVVYRIFTLRVAGYSEWKLCLCAWTGRSSPASRLGLGDHVLCCQIEGGFVEFVAMLSRPFILFFMVPLVWQRVNESAAGETWHRWQEVPAYASSINKAIEIHRCCRLL